MRLDRGAGFISKTGQQTKGSLLWTKGKTAEGRCHPLRYPSWDAAEDAADCHFSGALSEYIEDIR